jgi:hypothetical protein
MSVAAPRRRMIPAMSPRTERILWSAVAILFVLAMAALCWNNIRQTLDQPIYAELAFGGDLKPAHIAGGTAHASATGITTVGVQLTHVSGQLQWLLALSLANMALIQTAVGLVFGVIWVRTSAGRPFARSVSRSLFWLAIVVAVFGTMQEILQSWVSLRESFEAVGNPNFTNVYYNSTGFQVSGVNIFIGLGIGVLATAFGIGARLTQETEGLV